MIRSQQQTKIHTTAGREFGIVEQIAEKGRGKRKRIVKGKYEAMVTITTKATISVIITKII